MRPARTIRKKVEVDDASRMQTYGSERNAKGGAVRSNVFLIGPRGSGKTTLGRMLADQLQRPFVDTDELLTVKAGRSVARIVAEEGWEAFRALEHETLAEVCTGGGQVVATGGGIVLLPENRALMRSCGKVFYLMAEPPLLMERLERDPLAEQRPALSGLPPREELARTLLERAPLYMECADFILKAEDPPEELAREASALLAL
jgi:shikimate kinase